MRNGIIIKSLDRLSSYLKKIKGRKRTEAAREARAAKVAERRSNGEESQNGREAASAGMRKKRESVREIGDIPETRLQEIYEACRYDLPLFLKTYMPEAFYLEWSPDHLKVLAKIEEAVLRGGLFAEAMPRGQGKTTILAGAAVWAILYGHRRFVTIIAAEAQLAKAIMMDITKEFLGNDLLYRDFPIECHAVRALEGISQRGGAQLYQGKATDIKWTKEIAVFPNIQGSECRGSVIIPRGVTGAIRGIHHKTSEGEVLRPDFVMLDDPQTEESARSQTQCQEREELIMKAILGLAGPKKRISAILPCTVIQKNDLIDRMLSHKLHPEFQGERMKLVYKWPKTQKTLWQRYSDLRKEGLAEGDLGQRASLFYWLTKAKMDEGAELAWTERYNEDEFSALQHAENLRIDRGDAAFMGEYQNEPEDAKPALYQLDVNIVARRVNHLEIRTAPADAPFIVGFIDVNPAYGLSWVMAAFRNDMAGFVLDYGKYPEQESVPLVEKDLRKGVALAQAIFTGLNTLIGLIMAIQWMREKTGVAKIDLIMIDCGHEMATIGKFIGAARFPFPVVASRGRDSRRYKPTKPIGTPKNNLHLTEFALVPRVIVHNADYWRVHTQKAFLLSAGAPCSISLHGTDPKKHSRFARHICAETLVEFLKGDIADSYNWALQPGEHNDLLDCTVGCCVAACYAGADVNYNQVTEQSQAPATQEKKKRPRFRQHEI